jgi:hypothetical protein
LLEFALERLWLKAVERGSYDFTHADYDRLGGLGGAIAQHAEEVYQSLATIRELGRDPQRLAEQIFTSVISSQGTRRPRARDELEAETHDQAHARRVIDHLVGERLLTIRSDYKNPSMGQVDITHEILIDRWVRLKGWLDQDRASLQVREEINNAAQRWEAKQKDVNFLVHRGSRLQEAEALLKQGKFRLNEPDRSYVDACVALREQEEKGRRRTRWYKRIAVGAMGVFLVLAVIAEVQRSHAKSRQLAASAISQLMIDPERSVLLAVEAVKISRTVQAEAALRQSLLELRVRAVMRGHQDRVRSVAFSPDYKWVVTASSDRTARVWEASTGQSLIELHGHTDAVNSAAFSPDGKFG